MYLEMAASNMNPPLKAALSTQRSLEKGQLYKNHPPSSNPTMNQSIHQLSKRKEAQSK